MSASSPSYRVVASYPKNVKHCDCKREELLRTVNRYVADDPDQIIIRKIAFPISVRPADA